jgi:hypothetical protein
VITVETEATLALLPSPLLGPSAWEPVADLLRERGRDVSVLSVPDAPAGPADVLHCFLDGLPVDRELVLVPHSNAGLYVPELHAERDVVGVVFVDAALPGPGPTTPVCPPELRAHLTGLADADGWLPPWTHWWSEEDLAPLFGSATARQRVEAGQPRLPLSYFDASVPTPPGWDRHAVCSYLAFGDTYAAECRRAGSAGWPFESLVGSHLHMLVDPAEVADAIARLAEVPIPPALDAH